METWLPAECEGVFDTSRHGKVRELRPGQCPKRKCLVLRDFRLAVNVIAMPELANL